MDTQRRFVPIEDIARYFSVSISTIRAWVRQNKIPSDTYIKVGNTYRFSIPKVEDALLSADAPQKDADDNDELDDPQMELDFESGAPVEELDVEDDLDLTDIAEDAWELDSTEDLDFDEDY